MRTLLIIIALFCFSLTGESQGLLDGFLKGKNNLDLAFSAFHQTSNQFYAGVSKVKLTRNIFSIGAFGAYGITNKWDVVLNLPLINGQLQDAAIGTKYELIKTKLFGKQLSILPSITFSTPLSNYNTENSQAVGQKATVISPRLIVQQNLPFGLFIQLQSGYNYALSPVTSSVPFSTKLGGSFGKLYVDFWYDYQKGFGNKDYSGAVPYSSFRELVVNHNRVGGVFYYTLKEKTGVFFNYSYTINGRNTSQALGLGAGVVFKLKTK
ncbi:MAG: hypothetical protein ACPGU5_02880 [Lishizhenia sp.]